MEQRKVIAFDANPLVGGKTGVGQLTHELILSIAKNNTEADIVGHYFDFLDRKRPDDLPRAKNITYRKTTLIPTKLLSLLRRFGIRLPFEFFCRVKSDVIIFTNFVSQPSLFRSQIILCVYDMCFVDHPEYVSDKNGQYLRKWTPKSIKSANNILTISEFTKHRIEVIYKTSPKVISVMPVPPRPHIKPKVKIIQKHGLNNYLVFVGTIEPRKNILRLIEAYEKMSKKYTDSYPLVLVGGKGWKDSTIINKINNLKRSGYNIIQTGYVTDGEKAALYMSATIAIQPSIYEGFGMPILEAMSYGLPVVCSDIPVFHEVAKDAALYFEHTDVNDIADKISQVLSDNKLRTKLSTNSKKHISQYPDWNDAGKIVSSLID